MNLPLRTHASDNRLTSDLNGTIAVHDGDRVKVKTDLGNIDIHTRDPSGSALATTAFTWKRTAAKKMPSSC